MGFLQKIFGKPKLGDPGLPFPGNYPNSGNVPEWMEQTAKHWEASHPEEMFKLFCPSFGDYLPQKVAAGASSDAFRKNVEVYRALKAKYPAAVEEAKRRFCEHSLSAAGPSEDYPN